MMNNQIQAAFFVAIKEKLSPAISLADEIAQELKISTDSAYRRIRGEKSLSMEELFHLAGRYQVSLDQLFQLQGNGFLFQGIFVEPAKFQFDKYLMGISQQMQYIGSFPNSHLYYMCKDIPMFYHFQYRDLAAFKYYFWMKTIVNHPDFRNKAFSFDDYSDELWQLGQKIPEHYSRFPSTEVWNVESINSTLQQISFYRDTDMFVNHADILRVYEAVEQLIRHLEQQATVGIKWFASGSQPKEGAAYNMYHNEFILGDNSVLGITGHSKQAFLVHSVINFMITQDARFCDHLHTNIHNLLRRSTLISTDSEQERNAFFRQMYRKIDQAKQTLQH